MEEAEKRKERLQAMRAEAASVSVPVPDAAGHHLLPSPFSSTGPSSSSAASPSFSFPPRFDYYTDPLGSFSSATNKRKAPRGGLALQSPHGFSFDATPPAAGHGVMGNSPRIQSHGQWRSRPMGMNSPFETNPNIAPPSFRSPNYGAGFHNQPRGISFSPSPNPTPNFVSGMRSGIGGFSPNPNSSPRGMGSGYGSFSPNHNSNLNSGRGRGSFSPIRNPNFSSGKGSGRGVFSPNQTPSFSSGRGGGRHHGSSPRSVSGRNGGRGRGFVSAQECPWRFYHKSMMEDPWKGVAPIVGRLLEPEPVTDVETLDSLRSWLPKSIAAKKTKVANDTVELNPHSSIAECLALSFEDAVTDLPDQ